MTEERLFDLDPNWTEHWEDMPDFALDDKRAHGGSLRVYFRTDDDRREFLKLIGCGDYLQRSRGLWYPFTPRPTDAYGQEWEPEKVRQNKYPVYIISKGRWSVRGNMLTYIALDKLGIDYRIVVEPQERERYAEYVAEGKILALPFGELGQGSIPARNWVWDHAVETGAARHWILDDNIQNFARLNNNRARIIKDENPFIPCEEFADRYKNIALAGLQYRGFADAANPETPPYRLNTRVYSCILINHAIPFRWRGRYNEDTDLSLRALKAGWCTVLLNAYQIHKVASMVLNGGNTDDLYAGDGRALMAESLRDQHPDVVSITEKWDRVQHVVDYGPFRRNELIPVEQMELL